MHLQINNKRNPRRIDMYSATPPASIPALLRPTPSTHSPDIRTLIPITNRNNQPTLHHPNSIVIQPDQSWHRPHLADEHTAQPVGAKECQRPTPWAALPRSASLDLAPDSTLAHDMPSFLHPSPGQCRTQLFPSLRLPSSLPRTRLPLPPGSYDI
jgi:hypothetical protein